jgi:DNA-binding response OmpR family regulator
MRILVVEDDKKIASFIVKGLQQAGFAVNHAEKGIFHAHKGHIEVHGRPAEGSCFTIGLPRG